jgi:hypothetical protein
MLTNEPAYCPRSARSQAEELCDHSTSKNKDTATRFKPSKNTNTHNPPSLSLSQNKFFFAEEIHTPFFL